MPMTTSCTLRAPAKVNLYLGVHTAVDDEGYHLLDTVMHALDLHDTVKITWMPNVQLASLKIQLTTTPSLGIPDQSNLAYRAATLLHKACCPHLLGTLQIALTKAIPHQAGLGGGSSDAAAVLKGLAAVWNLSLNDERILKVAQTLGADVAFFLDEAVRPAYLTRRGDLEKERFHPLSGAVLLVKPDAPVSTAAAYRHFDLSPCPIGDTLSSLIEAMRTGTQTRPCEAYRIASLFANNLTSTASDLQPSIKTLIDFLVDQDVCPLLCGSGSALCVPLASPDQSPPLIDALSRYESQHGEKLWVLPTRFC